MAVLNADRQELERTAIRADFLADTLPEVPDEQVDHVVFIIHGIRDDGYWTRKLAQKIRECADASGQASSRWRCVTASYGYFAMLPFLLPWIRRQKVEWLMDEYVSVRAQFPNARVSYIGHSNGTYLAARALVDYPAVCFRHVLFAGSVVRRDFDWQRHLHGHRVERVVNMVATRDWVVALFPTGLEPLRKAFDLGGAGFGGFRQARDVPELHEVRYVIGAHSAGLVETQWPRIANFIVNGRVPASPDPDYATTQSLFWRGISKVASWILLLAALGAAGVLALILHPVFDPGTSTASAVARVLGAITYVIALRFVVTRV